MYRKTSASSVNLHDILRTELPKSLGYDPHVITEAVIDKSGFVVRHGKGPQVGGLPGGAGTYQTIDVLVVNEKVDAKTVALIRSGKLSAKNLVTPVDLKLGGASMTKKAAQGLEARLGTRPLLIGQDGRYNISRSSLNRIKRAAVGGESGGSEGGGGSGKSGRWAGRGSRLLKYAGTALQVVEVASVVSDFKMALDTMDYIQKQADERERYNDIIKGLSDSSLPAPKPMTPEEAEAYRRQWARSIMMWVGAVALAASAPASSPVSESGSSGTASVESGQVGNPWFELGFGPWCQSWVGCFPY
jgi:hypothetical protein